MKISLFTSSDENFFPLFEEMLSSLMVIMDDNVTVSLFDDGISSENLAKLPSFVNVIKAPNIKSFYPAFEYATTPAANALAVRPFLNDYAPEADIIVWVDADIWFQDRQGLTDFIWATEFGDFAVVPEVGPIVSYVNAHDAKASFEADLLNYYGEEAVKKLSKYPAMNLGLFASKTNSQIWNLWRKDLNTALEASKGAFHFGIEQAALNYTILSRNIPFSPLPSTYNYNARLVTSLINGELRTNSVPFEKIHNIHLISDAKWKEKTLIKRKESGEVLEVLNIKMNYKSIQNIVSSFQNTILYK
jgi:hypothetical protein